MDSLFSMPVYTRVLEKDCLLVAKHENNRNELLVYDESTISLVKEGCVQKKIVGNVRGCNDFSGCVYAIVPEYYSHLALVDMETLCASPTPISSWYDKIVAVNQTTLVGHNLRHRTLCKFNPNAR